MEGSYGDTPWITPPLNLPWTLLPLRQTKTCSVTVLNLPFVWNVLWEKGKKKETKSKHKWSHLQNNLCFLFFSASAPDNFI